MNEYEPVILDDEVSTESLDNLFTKQPPPKLTIKPVVHRCRSIWFEFFLGLITLTISWCFWAIGRANDLKNMRSNDYTPWLWCFAPLVVLTQPFAFSRIFGALRQIDGERVNVNVSSSVSPDFHFKGVDSLVSNIEVESITEYESFLEIDDELNYTERDH